MDKKYPKFFFKILLTLLITICIFFNGTIFFSFADTYIPTAVENETDSIYNKNALENIPAELKESLGDKINTAVELDEADSENLSSFTAINENGSKSLYIFEQPIKYIDTETGKIEFYDNTLKDSNSKNSQGSTYAYENSKGDVKVYLPEVISDGVKLVKDEYYMEFKPLTDESQTISQAESKIELKNYTFVNQKQKVAEYKSSYAEGYNFQFMPVNGGIKENIYIEQYNGVNKISYLINAGELSPMLDDNKMTVEFIDENNDESIFIIMPTFIQDSYTDEYGNVNITYDNYYEIKDIGRGEFILTTVLDERFLTDPNTVYPLLVDPYVYSTGTITDKNISDCYLMRNPPPNNTNSGSGNQTSNYVFAGTNTSYETMWHVKVNCMSSFKYIHPDRIESAEYMVKPNFTSGSGKLRIFDSNTQNTMTQLCNGGNWSSWIISSGSYTVPYSHTNVQSFDVKNLVIKWLKYELGDAGGKNQNYGFFVQMDPNTTSNSAKSFFSTRGSAANCKIVITYTEYGGLADGIYYIKVKDSGKYLSSNSTNSIYHETFFGTQRQMWDITRNTDGTYRVIPLGKTNASLNAGTNVDNSPVTWVTNDNSTYQRWRIVYNNSDNTFRMMAKSSGSRCLTIGSNGYAVQLGYNNNNTNQKVIFEKKEYNIDLRNICDLGFLVRYGNGNISSVSSNINNMETFIDSIFSSKFSLTVNNSNTFGIGSRADMCKTNRNLPINSTTIDQPCPGGAGHVCALSGHNNENCTSGDELYKHVISFYPGNVNRVTILWTGNKLFELDDDGNLQEANRSFSWYDYGINMQELVHKDYYFDVMIPVLAHELSHQCGAPDHYHEILEDGSCRGGDMCADSECANPNPRPSSCLMNDGWMWDIQTKNVNDIWCTGCQTDMQKGIHERLVG